MAQAAQSQKIGAPVRRREDLRLVTGKGRFSDDVNLPQQVYAAMLRSPHAHACLRGIDNRKALALPGVIAVLTGVDFVVDYEALPAVTATVAAAEPGAPRERAEITGSLD